MTKFRILIVLAIFLLGGFYFFLNNGCEYKDTVKYERIETHGSCMRVVGRVAFLNRDISPGEILASSDMKEQELEAKDIPRYSLSSIDFAVGRKAKYPMKKGHLLLDIELEPLEQNGEPFYFVANKNIPKGNFITTRDLKLVKTRMIRPSNAVRYITKVAGKEAYRPIMKGQIITRDDVLNK